MMSTNVPEAVKTNAGVAYVTSFRTHFVQLMDFVKQCASDDQAKNAWSSICSIEVGLLGQIVRNSDLQEKFDVDAKSIEDAKALIKKWSSGAITQIEKTRFERFESDGGEAIYRMLWDSIPAECAFSELETVSAIIDHEKQSQMVQRLIQFSGECMDLIMGLGILDLDDPVAVPFKPEDQYSTNQMAQDVAMGRVSPRQSPRKAQ